MKQINFIKWVSILLNPLGWVFVCTMCFMKSLHSSIFDLKLTSVCSDCNSDSSVYETAAPSLHLAGHSNSDPTLSKVILLKLQQCIYKIRQWAYNLRFCEMRRQRTIRAKSVIKASLKKTLPFPFTLFQQLSWGSLGCTFTTPRFHGMTSGPSDPSNVSINVCNSHHHAGIAIASRGSVSHQN